MKLELRLMAPEDVPAVVTMLTSYMQETFGRPYGGSAEALLRPSPLRPGRRVGGSRAGSSNIGPVNADAQRGELEGRAQAYVAKLLAGFDAHGECKGADRCLAVGYTELGESGWDELTKNLPPELTDDDDESTRAQEILGETFKVAWLSRVKACK